MVASADQCPSHTRSPWGKARWRQHRYPPILRMVMMALLCICMIGLIAVTILFLADFCDRKWGRGGFIGTPEAGSEEVGAEGGQNAVVKRADERHRPFYPCGDQLNGCQRFFKPNICCLVGLACYETELTYSGVYCCNNGSACLVSEEHIPTCPNGTTPCGAAMDGGCCPRGTTCSPNGCLQVLAAAGGFAADAEMVGETAHGTPGGGLFYGDLWAWKRTTPTAPGLAGRTGTATGVAAVTHTGVKYGEVGMSGTSKLDSGRWWVAVVVMGAASFRL